MPNAQQVFLELIRIKTKRPLAVFDLDSTLYNVSIRTQKIVMDFTEVKEFQRSYPAEVEFLKSLKVSHREWGLKESLQRAGLKSNERFYKTLRDFWSKHFFSSPYLDYDVPYDGASEYVNALKNEGIQIKYLTGRDEQNMFQGTVKSLKQHNFPLDDVKKQLIMKPLKGSIEDEDFKAEKFKDLVKLSKDIWFFENEPLIIKKVSEQFPHVKIVWIDTTHSRREHPPTGVYIIQDRWQK